MNEPRLSAADQRCWDGWQMAFSLRARSIEFRRRLDSARRLAAIEIDRARTPMVGWSGGKDSTALAHLVVVDLGLRHVRLVSEKDDLDYPGEEDYVRALATAWNARLDVVRPATSPASWIERRASFMDLGDDIHGRSSGLSKACFYGVMDDASHGHDLVMMGLRSEESGRRRNLLRARGMAYTIANGTRRAHPIGEWSGMDVFAYLQTVGVEPLHVYRCVSLMHSREPWQIRKSWWLPGRSAAHGQVAWLKRYYPSLFARLSAWFPSARAAT